MPNCLNFAVFSVYDIQYSVNFTTSRFPGSFQDTKNVPQKNLQCHLKSYLMQYCVLMSLFDFVCIAEMARIIPASYGSWRKNKLYNPYKDIRSNLFHHYNSNRVIRRPT